MLDLPPALHSAVVACAAVIFVCWLLSVITKDYSQVDRVWSIAPPLYVGWFAWSAGFGDARANLMLLLSAAWGARLTYNFARKGGYQPGVEDYRWPILRSKMGPIQFQLFNATFIAPFQNALLLALALPAFVATQNPGPLTTLDLAAAAAFALLLVGETVADNQQWRFQTDKHARKARGEAVAAEFLTTGLFRYSRHPNFFCEIGMWWCFYAFSVGAGAGTLNWSVAGPVVLTLLFQGSTGMTEGITLSKYPAYAGYQRVTSRLLPLPPRGEVPGVAAVEPAE